MGSRSADPGGDRNQDRPPTFPSLIPSWKGLLAAFDANIWITGCSGRAQIWRISCSISGASSTPIAPVTHGTGERRICQCHPRSPICATLSRSISDTHSRLSFQSCALPARCRSPRAKTRNEIIRVGVRQFFIAAGFGNLAVSLPQYQFASHTVRAKVVWQLSADT